MAGRQAKEAPAEAQYEDFDPTFEWQENPTNHVLRVSLPGFKKEDFRVQVDGLGRLTVRGQHPVGDGKYRRFHKVFQLPDISVIGEITGRFEGNVLSVTVPKPPVPPPKELPAEEVEKKEEDHVKPKEEPKKEEKPIPGEKKEEPTKLEEKKEEAPSMAAGEEPKDVEGEKISERPWEKVMRRVEEKAKAEAEMAEKAEEKKASSWKERVKAELGGLSDFKWADDALDKIKKNKEVIAAAAAAFTLGFIISKKICSRK